MTLEIAAVLLITAGAAALFITEKLRMDVVALLVLVTLALLGLVKPAEAPHGGGWRAPFALVSVALVVGAAALGWVDIAIAAVAGSVAMVLAGCVRARELYDEIDWQVLFLMAGLLPLGIAVSKSGAAQLIVDHTLGLMGALGPHVVLAALYLLASVLCELMSDTAAAVVLTPVAISTAHLLHAEVTPFLMAMTFAISTSFLTPIGHHTNTMIYSAGGYKFTDFIRVGTPLNLILWGLSMVLIPVFWPLKG